MQGPSSKHILSKINSLYFKAIQNARHTLGYKLIGLFKPFSLKFSPDIRAISVFALVFFAAVPPIMGFGHKSPLMAGGQHSAMQIERQKAADAVRAMVIGYPVAQLVKDHSLVAAQVQSVQAPDTQGNALASVLATAAEQTTLPASDIVQGLHPISVEVTSYCLSGTTALGTNVSFGTVAVDPSVIPLMSYVYVPGYGWSVAVDTGSGIKGNHIDIWLPWTNDCQASTDWGVHYNMTVFVASNIIGPLPRDLRDIIQEAQQNGW